MNRRDYYTIVAVVFTLWVGMSVTAYIAMYR